MRVGVVSRFIACGTFEALYIIDILFTNTSAIQPDTLHADTQGQTTPVFALTHLLGITLLPRIRNWADLVFYRPSTEARYQHIGRLATSSVTRACTWDGSKTGSYRGPFRP